jgi:WD40 repeat protein
MFHRRHQSTGHRAALYALAESHERGFLLAAGGDGWVSEWDIAQPETGRVVAQVGTPIYSMAISPPHWPEHLILCGNMLGGLHWVHRNAPDAGRNVLHHSKGIFDILWIENEVFSAGGDGVLTRWDPKLERAVESIALSNRSLRAIAYVPQQDLLAVGASDGHIHYLRKSSFEIINTAAAHDPSVFALCWSLDGQTLFSGGRDAHLKAWNLAGTQIWSVPAHLATINHIVLSPDGQHLATAGRDKQVRIWATDGLRLLKALDPIRDRGHINSVNRLVWNSSGLFSCSDDKTLILWDS